MEYMKKCNYFINILMLNQKALCNCAGMTHNDPRLEGEGYKER